jgi:uncharacterized repeat protein (TIGR01451 family)
MKTLTRSIRAMSTLGLLISSAAFLSAPVDAQENPEALRIVALNLTAQDEGRTPEEGADAPVSRPGDVIEYRLSFTNTATGLIRDVVFDDPIPPGLVFVVGSAGAEREGVVVEFSIDGGSTYHSSPEIEVEEGGRTVRRPAPPERYTHVRWTVQGSVAAGEEVRALFRARVAGGLAEIN